MWDEPVLARLSYLALAVAPWLASGNPAGLVVLLLIAASIPATFFNVGFNPMFADIVPEQTALGCMATRSIIAGATTAVFSFVAGCWLEYPAP